MDLVKGVSHCAFRLRFIVAMLCTLACVGLFTYSVKRDPAVTSLLTSVGGACVHGRLSGDSGGKRNDLPVWNAEPGDIILCHNAGGAYGYWTHAVLYVGRGLVVDSNNFVHGTALFPVSDYTTYERAILLRPRTGRQVREHAAQFALREIGKPYDPFASLANTHTEYCSKLVWEAYAHSGYALGRVHEWIVPDQIAESKRLDEVR